MDERAAQGGPAGVHVSHALGLDLCGLVLDDRYEIIRRIGSGGMAAVYEGRRRGLQRRVAVKILRPELAENESNVRRFLREARSAASVEHPNVVSIEDVGGNSRPVYFVMEYLEGVDLRMALRSHGRFDWPRTRELALQIVGALGAAHATGIVHRDVKPANCFIVREPGKPEHVKVLDFGIAKVLEESQDYTHVTATHGIVGTVAYMAPEQAKSGTVDPRTDVYALGTMLYEMLAGTVPFPDKNPFVVIGRLLGESPLPLRMHRPDLSTEIEALVMTCLEKDPDARFQSMDALRGALLSCDRNDAVLGTAKVEVPTGPSGSIVVSRFVTQPPPGASGSAQPRPVVRETLGDSAPPPPHVEPTAPPSAPGRSGRTTPMRAQSGAMPVAAPPSEPDLRRPAPTTPIPPAPRGQSSSRKRAETDAPQPRPRGQTDARTSRGVRGSAPARAPKSNAAMLGVVVGGLGMIALGGTATWWALHGSKAAARTEAGASAPTAPLVPSPTTMAPQVAPVLVPVPSAVPTPVEREPAVVEEPVADTGATEAVPSVEPTRRGKRTPRPPQTTSDPQVGPEPPPRRDPDPPPRRDPDPPEPSISPDLRNPFTRPKN